MNRFTLLIVGMTLLSAFGDSAVVRTAHADVIAEYLFWDNMGKAVGSAAKNYSDYKAQRRLWRDKIAQGEARLHACGGCAERAEIERDLTYWKTTENKFQEIAGQAFVAVGMPPNVAKALGIDMPLTPGLSAAEAKKLHEVARPTWTDDRPEFCRRAVDDYVGCLRHFKSSRNTVFTGNAKMPGGVCYDQHKLFRHCAAENYKAFHAEAELQKKRVAGAIIPEYLEYAHEVYYGDVPDDFMPMVPSEIVLEKLKKDEKPHEVRFSMRKQRPELLSVMVVRPFHHGTVVPNNHCQGVDQPTNEIEHRICYDFYTLSLQVRPLVLFCQYSRADRNMPLYLEAYKFWYRPPPAEAEPKHLLSRAENHPALVVAGPPRTECPATQREAEQIQTQWQATVSKVRAETPQIAAHIALPKPQWLINQNRRSAEVYEILERRKAATKAFPFEGVYVFQTTLDGETIEGRCTMHPTGMMEKHQFLLHCQHPGGETLQRVRYPHSGWLQIRWQISGKPHFIHYLADEADPNTLEGNGDHNALVANGDRDDSISGRLVRTSELTPLSTFPVEGVYSYEGTANDEKESGQCTITTYKRHQPPSFHFDCVSDANVRFSNTARHRDNVLFVSWSSREGINMGPLAFIVTGNPVDGQKKPQMLVGRSSHGAHARLMRTRDLPSEPEPVSPKVHAQQHRAAIDEQQREAIVQRKLAQAQRLQARDATRGGAETQEESANARSAPASERCTVEEIAGSYRTGYGQMVCEVSEGGLACCYGGRCKKKARLALDESGRNLEGTWNDTRREGTVRFPLSSECELESGRWKPSDRKAYGVWRVVGKIP
ncbi:MAG: hypothetical protein KZQ93_01415 [Candidatus Thiodiazotropha sp. (ex Monitilora ramsayi)]|nr:hypothetical protein [Candidatus Thiodiazotropha sp. (ex Monitilora ramsayi)]